MAYLLHIESSSTACSVAISRDNELLELKEINNGYTHAENLHLFIEELLQKTGLHPKDLQAISVSSGPGSYTGLRIGFSAAKGLAFSLNIPLISVSTLQALTSSVIKKEIPESMYCPLLDARRMEVYCGVFDVDLKEIIPVQPLILNEETIHIFKQNKPIYFFGDGMPKTKLLLQSIPNSYFIDDVFSSAKALVKLAYEKYLAKDFVNTAYAEPLYVKDFFFTTAKQKI